jgi:hypothetical protein
MTGHITIRQLGSGDDVSDAARLLQRFFREEGFDTPDDVIARNTALMSETHACGLFVAEEEGGAIGVATVFHGVRHRVWLVS